MLKKLTFLLLIAGAVACSDDSKEVIIDSSLPQGDFSVAKSGSIVEQGNTGSKGSVELGTDSEGTTFLHFGADFETSLATGTVTVFFSTSDTYMAEPMEGNPDIMLVAPVQKNGEMYFKIDGTVPAKFTHVILWCASAQIPFGYAELK